MSNRKALVQCVEENYQLRESVLVLADWFQEYEGLERFPALMKAARIARRAWNNDVLVDALQAMQHTSIYYWRLHETISALIGRQAFDDMEVRLRGGRMSPRGKEQWRRNGNMQHICWVVDVGARWVMGEVKRWDEEAERVLHRPGYSQTLASEQPPIDHVG